MVGPAMSSLPLTFTARSSNSAACNRHRGRTSGSGRTRWSCTGAREVQAWGTRGTGLVLAGAGRPIAAEVLSAEGSPRIGAWNRLAVTALAAFLGPARSYPGYRVGAQLMPGQTWPFVRCASAWHYRGPRLTALRRGRSRERSSSRRSCSRGSRCSCGYRDATCRSDRAGHLPAGAVCWIRCPALRDVRGRDRSAAGSERKQGGEAHVRAWQVAGFQRRSRGD